jgi:hypothetical protein
MMRCSKQGLPVGRVKRKRAKLPVGAKRGGHIARP